MKRDRTQREALRGKLHMILGLIAEQVEVDTAEGGKEHWTAADGPRYKALGNSWAVPCARWIGERIEAVEAIK